MRAFSRFCLGLLMALMQGALITWAFCAPIVWIVRDGLGPDSQESGWGLGLLKFAAQWGIPALVLAVPLYGLVLLDRRLAPTAAEPRAPR
jgi:hypothetical protein